MISLCKASWHVEVISSSLGFINQVVDSDAMKITIFFFEPERGFSDVFNNSVNQSFVKKDKNIFKLIYIFKNAFRFHYRETKMAQII